MSTPRLHLVMGGPSASEGGEVRRPLPHRGTFKLHLPRAQTPAPAAEAVRRPLGGWGGLIVGIGLMAAFAGGYQFGHRPAPDDVLNLRPMPALGNSLAPEPALPSPAALGLPAIQRQLATPPQVIPPTRAPQQPGVVTTAPVPAGPVSNRNAFGLEN